MPTSNIFNRTLHIRYKSSSGTAFTVDVENRQYLLTAKHVVDGIKDGDSIEIYHDDLWKSLVVKPIYLADTQIDIIILVFQQQVTPITKLIVGSNGLTIGGDIYFMGFPYGFSTNVGDLNFKFPLALVKKGVVSGSDQNNSVWLLDGHNNPGFSGGPVIFFPQGNMKATQIVAVISGYRAIAEPIMQQDTATPYHYRYNTGIIISWDIRFAIEAIHNNPIGFELNNPKGKN